MKRWLFNLAAALSLLLSTAAAAAWAMSYARPPGWRLIGIAHSADLTRVNRGRRTVLFTTAANRSKARSSGASRFYFFRRRRFFEIAASIPTSR